jgi:hypothetical protein
MTDILLHIPSYKPLTPRGNELLQVIIDRLRSVLHADLDNRPGEPLSSDALYFLKLSTELAATKRVGHPYYLLSLLRDEGLTDCQRVAKLAQEDQPLIIWSVLEALTSSKEVGEVREPLVGPTSSDLDNVTAGPFEHIEGFFEVNFASYAIVTPVIQWIYTQILAKQKVQDRLSVFL